METENIELNYSDLGFYHKIWNMRSDTWNHVKEDIGKLRDKTKKLSDAKVKSIRQEIDASLKVLDSIEEYTAFPSKQDFKYLWKLFDAEDYGVLFHAVSRIGRALSTNAFRKGNIALDQLSSKGQQREEQHESSHEGNARYALDKPYFELLVVDNFKSLEEEESVRKAFRDERRPEDRYIYDVVCVSTFEDALVAILVNPNIQSCMIRYGFPFKSTHDFSVLDHFVSDVNIEDVADLPDVDRNAVLGSVIHKLRPEIDLFMVTSVALEETAGKELDYFHRIFYREQGYIEHHHSVLQGVHDRFQTPFFTALQEYSKRPTGVFHAMPISRGKSILRSNWIGDMADFYGTNIFMAETSSTSGGLDSLLAPHGPMKKMQELASRAFGSRETYFVTNGTSTANKIVVQAIVEPNDIVLVDRDCHKSHHYGMVLMGAHVDYLDSYPLHEYSMYGGVPLKEIKKKLLAYKRAGKLDRVKMLLLTNCTFDGIVYNVRRFMEECLAIKPDLIFLWDEAWFAFAGFNPVYRPRTGMYTSQMLRTRYRSAEYRKEYEAYKKKFDKLNEDDDKTWLNTRLMPDPDQVRVRCYTTHSTHKTLTSLRQGSMIHVFDQDFRQKVKAPFDEAYMTHTSTSPNYQILASLDVGRRQVELEGYEMVHKQIEAAMTLREFLYNDPLMQQHFPILRNKDLVPKEYRQSGVESYYDPETGWSRMEEAWLEDEFVVDPTRITLFTGKAGVDGDTFKNEYLMDKYGIQINKTSRNSVLFMTNIGTTRSSIAYLIDVLGKIAREIEQIYEESSPVERKILDNQAHSLTHELPALPDFSSFHSAFRPGLKDGTPEGYTRDAFFMSYNEDHCEYIRADNGDIQAQMKAGREVVSANFVTPYPPGFPILVPGQVISSEIMDFMMKLDVKEIHGYRPELGLCVFRQESLGEKPKAKKKPAAKKKTAKK